MKNCTANNIALTINQLRDPYTKRYDQNAPVGLETFGPTSSSRAFYSLESSREERVE
jgi:hypothetical protein